MPAQRPAGRTERDRPDRPPATRTRPLLRPSPGSHPLTNRNLDRHQGSAVGTGRSGDPERRHSQRHIAGGPGVEVRITGGHTTGHAQYVITGGGTRLIASGDALRSPIQADHPEWSCVHDGAAAADHRRRLLADPDTISPTWWSAVRRRSRTGNPSGAT
ncbi:MBL fold metallo-hydrolase [Spirillospora sp. NPDC048911]|uniref:MBL fold metallo-hydrolase n=1 Tax=Spirillospora sp. NPDC048911 TaxID=3364527 RepID=UPI00371D34ED